MYFPLYSLIDSFNSNKLSIRIEHYYYYDIFFCNLFWCKNKNRSYYSLFFTHSINVVLSNNL